MEQYTYVRVSTKEQNIDRQLIAIEPYQIPKKNLFCDYQSGKDFERPAYQRMLRRLKAGDLLIIKSIDRLGRDYGEILTEWQRITKEIGADILVLDMELLDTREKAGGLTGMLIADMVLQIMAYVAQTERDCIKQRQAEGIAAAKARGQTFGPKPMDMPEEFQEVCGECNAGRISTRNAAEKLQLSHTTFCRRYREWKKAKNEEDSGGSEILAVSGSRQFGTS
ncbi:MAG: recombinase family protein [Lachnospiraceae bacterium]|nr:recombinase family protein [Lachnospiraceae bacterium]